eukprot:7242174-Pyramimonas_sp.AAC.1
MDVAVHTPSCTDTTMRTSLDATVSDSRRGSEDGVCNICFERGHDDLNQLVSPCACRGSASLIHMNCL